MWYLRSWHAYQNHSSLLLQVLDGIQYSSHTFLLNGLIDNGKPITHLQRVLRLWQKLGIPMLLFMGGGYSDPIDDTVDAFTDLFFEAARAYQFALRA